VIPPHLLPLRIDFDGDLEWMAADSSGLLAWDRNGSRLMRYGEDGEPVFEVPILGTPVPANGSRNQFWVQNKERLIRWSCSGPERDSTDAVRTLLIRTAEADLQKLNLAHVDDALAGFLSVVDEELAFADELLSMHPAPGDPKESKGAADAMPMLQGNRAVAEEHLCKELHHWCVGQLKYELCSQAPQVPADQLAGIEVIRSKYAGPIRLRIDAMQVRMDAFGGRLARNPFNESADKVPPSGEWHEVASVAHIDLLHIQDMIARWFGIPIKP
jgi:hypothetical protein